MHFDHRTFFLGKMRPAETSRIVFSLLFLLLAALALPPAKAAQPPKDSPSETKAKSADQEWEELGERAKTGMRDFSAPAGITGQEARQRVILDLAEDAEKLRDFHTKHPNHARAKEAKRLEALTLIQAWQIGDDQREARRKQLVMELRKDPALSLEQRCEIAAFAENIGVEKRFATPGDARMAGFEQAARDLVAEFPGHAGAYEALVQIAKHSPDDRAQKLATDVLRHPDAPEWVKKEAQAINLRYALLGASIVEPTKPIIAANNPFVKAAGRSLIVYSWHSSHPPSIVLAKEIAATAPAGAAVIGVCLDQRDLAPAKATAEAEKLPGDQIYDWLGRRGEIAEALGAIDPGLVYLADADGIVRSVSAQRNLTAALAALRAR